MPTTSSLVARQDDPHPHIHRYRRSPRYGTSVVCDVCRYRIPTILLPVAIDAGARVSDALQPLADVCRLAQMGRSIHARAAWRIISRDPMPDLPTDPLPGWLDVARVCLQDVARARTGSEDVVAGDDIVCGFCAGVYPQGSACICLGHRE